MAQDEMPVIPATDSSEQYLQKAGIYLLQPVAINVYKDSNGIAKKDKTGNPGLLITFKNDKGEMINGIFYYSALPIDDPRRQDDAYRCKSEYQLANLKTAMGFETGKTVQPAEFLSKKVWIAVKEVQFYTPEGEYVKSLFDLIKKFYPYQPNLESKGKPSIMGDPALNKDGKPTGDFVEVKTDSGSYAKAEPQQEKKFKPTAQADTKEESTAEAEDALPEGQNEEPPDY